MAEVDRGGHLGYPRSNVPVTGPGTIALALGTRRLKMRWLSFAGTIFIGLWSVWLLLLAYRVVGKPVGQDPKYDASMEYWSGTFKVMGVVGLLAIALEVVSLVIEWL